MFSSVGKAERERERERERLPAANTYIEVADDIVFFFRESTVLDVRPQVIQPSQSATLSASLKPYNQTHQLVKQIILIHFLNKNQRELVMKEHISEKYRDRYVPIFWGSAIQLPPVPKWSI